MGHQIILKDNNEIVVYSSIVDDFIYEGDIEGYIEQKIKQSTKQIRSDILEIYEKLKNGENAYYQFQMTYQEACELRDANK